ncbi:MULTISPECIES: TlyA family RNA methyltransferase [Carboxydocella]|uniref:23S rRNA (Cytidine1920-2'-O)/16S rRNA (Cytidine1409-2'-O)-methyltransferase n=2 Tax=Carboxydocella TaxID=178898 RepID=A0A1T4NWL2_9FIRM|nr:MULTISPECIES: TlyA family RNA methyltransferase [Carboxydocella]AVX20157.1 23S rRNA (cytidine1920-2'-O)/16S rRNA (cytidine1409-2'-O)-methyltransferase [Carboxydocella thermautotrophica]AVX30576.1 23S rRNA (cytidine1920-2'-O)/16S rRNA (cytidine1409-2'-O)-methyltransferase [Carboxydocella thermautotrophica]SJZ83432.1 23S rRNA (cytidine1920-2'-O)/16S rRNA (cytidine1409-2'-O)-methyltransferase [Carboxydocella sporoproducens DSM 16521]GAW28428.1 ribosomal RNA large subunit methyltransferase J [Ca
MSKKRLDALLVEKGFFSSRERAKAAIMAGLVFVQGRKVDKAGEMVAEEVEIKIKGEDFPWVSRGGLKLEKALRVFAFSVKDRVVLDIGASTGGFTDVCLHYGARQVIAVDVGYGQLAWKLRQNPRVLNLERTNIRYLTKEELPLVPERVVIDTSFISLGLVLPRAWELSSADAQVIALVKPQFEAGREKVGKKGVVRDPGVHKEVLEKVTAMAREQGFSILGLDYSPIKGPEGNIEYLLWLGKIETGWSEAEVSHRIEQVIQEAFAGAQ